MPDGTTTRQVIYQCATISLRDGKQQQCWRVFFPKKHWPNLAENKREYLRQYGTAKSPGTDAKREAAWHAALACVDAFVSKQPPEIVA